MWILLQHSNGQPKESNWSTATGNMVTLLNCSSAAWFSNGLMQVGFTDAANPLYISLLDTACTDAHSLILWVEFCVQIQQLDTYCTMSVEL